MDSMDGSGFDETNRRQDTKMEQWSEQVGQMMLAPVAVICLLFTILLGVAFVVILSLIPTYLGDNNADSSTLAQDPIVLSTTYNTDLSNGNSFSIMDLNALNQQLAQVYRLRRINLSIISYSFNQANNAGRRKRNTGSTQCEDSSTSSAVSLNLQFSATPNKGQYTDYQWKQFLINIQKNIRSIYKQFSLRIPFSDGQTRIVQLSFCALELISIGSTTTTTPSTTNSKTRIFCPVAILGAGVGGAHSAYRLAPIHRNNLCIFERENHVGGRTFDVDSNRNPPPAYSTTPIAAMGAARFYEAQSVVKQLVDELNISYHRYDYQTALIKARGRFYTSYNTMCSSSYVDLNCTDDADGYNAQDQLWVKMMDEYNRSPLNLYRFADVEAFCRALFGDEATDYLKNSYRFRSDFQNIDAYSYMEYFTQEWNLVAPIYYPIGGMSQVAKRMIYQAINAHNIQSYLNEEVLRIDDSANSAYTFSIETTNYQVYSNQIVAAIPPVGWVNIQGTIANEIKSNKHFQSILPIKVMIIEHYWSRRWWEESSLFGSNVDRAWTQQNCISFIEIFSQQPEKREQNLTKTVYDDGLCVDMWSVLLERPSLNDLNDEILRGLRSIFIDVQIPAPTKTFTQIWPDAWHYQKSNSDVTNKQILKWALQPLSRWGKHQLSLVGEAFNIDRSGWIDGALKSSLFSLYSQFNFNTTCYQNDAAVNGVFCTADFLSF